MAILLRQPQELGTVTLHCPRRPHDDRQKMKRSAAGSIRAFSWLMIPNAMPDATVVYEPMPPAWPVTGGWPPDCMDDAGNSAYRSWPETSDRFTTPRTTRLPSVFCATLPDGDAGKDGLVPVSDGDERVPPLPPESRASRSSPSTVCLPSVASWSAAKYSLEAVCWPSTQPVGSTPWPPASVTPRWVNAA